jgi:hypothetical protein
VTARAAGANTQTAYSLGARRQASPGAHLPTKDTHLKLHEVNGPGKLEAELLWVFAESPALPSHLRQQSMQPATSKPRSAPCAQPGRNSAPPLRSASERSEQKRGKPRAPLSPRTYISHPPPRTLGQPVGEGRAPCAGSGH